MRPWKPVAPEWLQNREMLVEYPPNKNRNAYILYIWLYYEKLEFSGNSYIFL